MPEQVERFARAIRLAESGGAEIPAYSKMQGVVRGRRLLGAYGIAADDWEVMAEDSGYAGARWQDPSAQDMVVRATMQRLYEKYGDWRLVAVAWKAGEVAADKVAINPAVLNDKALAPLKSYVTQVMSNAKSEARIARQSPSEAQEGPSLEPEHWPTTLDNLQPIHEHGPAPMEDEAEAVLRRRLINLRDARRQQYQQYETSLAAEPVEEGAAGASGEVQTPAKPTLLQRISGRA